VKMVNCQGDGNAQDGCHHYGLKHSGPLSSSVPPFEMLEHNYEGLVAKDPESRYVGGRSLKWLKVKQPHYREGERGWEPRGKS